MFFRNVIERARKSKTTVFDFHVLKIPRWNYSGIFLIFYEVIYGNWYS